MEIVAKPFVKWAGGKGRILHLLDSNLPADFDDHDNITYIEPFVGGGAMLFHMLNNHPKISRVIINDINKELVRCYQLVKESPEVLIGSLDDVEKEYLGLNSIQAKKDFYYEIRDRYNHGQIDKNDKAALLIFLNKTCFNGLYRVNASGEFNVPYGMDRHTKICNSDLIWVDHEALQKVEICCGDYKSIKLDEQGDYKFIYLDPPYRPLYGAQSFKKYSEFKFEDKEQYELKQYCDVISQHGYNFMLSNSDSENDDGSSFFFELYKDYECDVIVAPRFINSFSAKKKKQTEVLIKNYRSH